MAKQPRDSIAALELAVIAQVYELSGHRTQPWYVCPPQAPGPRLALRTLPDAHEAGLLPGWKRMNGIFYLVGLIVVAIIVVYALGHW